MKELLIPAGDMNCLYQAVYNGCDAVYLSGQKFGARKFATNFSDSELIEAIKFCHLYGVKIYVTMNTLVRDSEVDDFISQARFLHKNGVDALIVQDFGMISLLREKFPNLEIHASTQANTASKQTCELLYQLGVKRVVFPREMSINEIDSIAVPIEKEAFIHGALCVSYSGCCLMSSMLGGRSGNRGECAGCCRMPFSLMHDNKTIIHNKYLLSMKELNTSSHIDDLIKSSIYSFKIEGRMKDALYVGFITRLYRRLIDGEDVNLSEETDKLKTIFNRKFTLGHLFNIDDDKLINDQSPNHIGLDIGNSEVAKDKIKINLNKGRVLNQFDAIRFLNSKKGMIINFLYDKNMMLCNSATGTCYVDNKIGIDDEDVVCKTHDHLLMDEYMNISNSKKVKVSFNVVAKVGNYLTISISDGINHISISSNNIIERAINAPTDNNAISKQLSKLGGTPFILDRLKIDIDDDIFIRVGTLNDLRRSLVDRLIDIRRNKCIEFIECECDFDFDSSTKDNINISCYVFTEEQLKRAIDLDVDRIYVNSDELYNSYKEKANVYLALERCSFDYQNLLMEKNLCSEVFNFNGYNVIGNYTMNVTNIYTAYYLKKLGLKSIPLSAELTEKEVTNLINLYSKKFGNCNFEVLSYGRVENMIIKGNLLNLKKFDYNYYLVDVKKRRFPVYFDGVNTHIYNHEYKKFISNKSICKRIDLYNEDADSLTDIIKRISM